MSKKKNRGKKLRKKAKKDWFNPEKIYKGGVQPWYTLKKSGAGAVKKEVREIEKKIQENLVEEMSKHEKPNVLEIGPGTSPSEIHTAGEKVYLDVERGFLKDKEGQKIKYKVGKGNLPFKDRAFGPTIMNEVLTHVKPENRKKVVDEVARVSDEVMITDRFASEDIMKKSPGLVNPKEIKEELEKKGFEVEVKMLEEESSRRNHFILYGKKKKEAEK